MTMEIIRYEKEEEEEKDTSRKYTHIYKLSLSKVLVCTTHRPANLKETNKQMITLTWKHFIYFTKPLPF